MPDIPVKPKLFNYKVDYKKPALYEYSSVEIKSEQIVNVDFDMGMPLDLIDRDIYQSQELKKGYGSNLESLKA